MWDIEFVCVCVCVMYVWVMVHPWEMYAIKTADISFTRIYGRMFFTHNAVLQLMEQWVLANGP